jgi:hypothetical protein
MRKEVVVNSLNDLYCHSTRTVRTIKVGLHVRSIVEKQGPTAIEEARVPSSGLSSLSISRSDGPGRPN